MYKKYSKKTVYNEDSDTSLINDVNVDYEYKERKVLNGSNSGDSYPRITRDSKGFGIPSAPTVTEVVINTDYFLKVNAEKELQKTQKNERKSWKSWKNLRRNTLLWLGGTIGISNLCYGIPDLLSSVGISSIIANMGITPGIILMSSGTLWLIQTVLLYYFIRRLISDYEKKICDLEEGIGKLGKENRKLSIYLDTLKKSREIYLTSIETLKKNLKDSLKQIYTLDCLRDELKEECEELKVENRVLDGLAKGGAVIIEENTALLEKVKEMDSLVKERDSQLKDLDYQVKNLDNWKKKAEQEMTRELEIVMMNVANVTAVKEKYEREIYDLQIQLKDKEKMQDQELEKELTTIMGITDFKEERQEQEQMLNTINDLEPLNPLSDDESIDGIADNKVDWEEQERELDLKYALTHSSDQKGTKMRHRSHSSFDSDSSVNILSKPLSGFTGFSNASDNYQKDVSPSSSTYSQQISQRSQSSQRSQHSQRSQRSQHSQRSQRSQRRQSSDDTGVTLGYVGSYNEESVKDRNENVDVERLEQSLPNMNRYLTKLTEYTLDACHKSISHIDFDNILNMKDPASN